jgi:hypothetical protein
MMLVNITQRMIFFDAQSANLTCGSQLMYAMVLPASLMTSRHAAKLLPSLLTLVVAALPSAVRSAFRDEGITGLRYPARRTSWLSCDFHRYSPPPPQLVGLLPASSVRAGAVM